MVTIYLLIGIIVTTCAVLGWLSYSLKKEKDSAEAAAVPISDPGEIEAISSMEAKIPSSPEPLSVAAGPTDVLPPRDPEVLQHENRQLKEEIQLIREKAVIQARRALEVINKLREEKEGLEGDLDKMKAGSSGIGDEVAGHLRAENAAFREQLSAATDEARRLNEQVDMVRRELGEQLLRANETIARLEEQNERFQSSHVAASEQEEKLARVRDEYEQKLRGLQGDLDAFRRDNEDLKAASGERSGDLLARIEGLELEREALKKRLGEGDLRWKEEADRSAHLQYELTKSRAQAAGLGRMCENAKVQFEEAAREARLMEKDNLALKQKAGVLERGLADLKKLNSELLKREKLTQFEVEKNRAQIKDLERIYGVFRSRLENAGIREEDLVIN